MSKQEKSLTDRIMDAVSQAGQASIDQILAEVGKHIPLAQAINKAQKELKTEDNSKKPEGKKQGRNLDSPIYTTQHLAEWGKRIIVSSILRGLCIRYKRLRRVSKGVYAVALKLYKPDNKVG